LILTAAANPLLFPAEIMDNLQNELKDLKERRSELRHRGKKPRLSG
jgi:hypothetical protein